MPPSSGTSASPQAPPGPRVDFDGDGAVTLTDYSTVVRNMGKTQTVVTSGGTITPAATKPPTNITWSGPLVITKCGTYTGNWQSTSAGTPAIQVRTTEPVIILNANISEPRYADHLDHESHQHHREEHARMGAQPQRLGPDPGPLHRYREF